MENKWYAIYTKTEWEYSVVKYLEKRGIHSYCPSKSIIKKWGVINRVVYKPLFPSYIFAHVTESQLILLSKVPGIISIVYWRKEKFVIRYEELECIQYFLNKYDVLQFEKIEITLNEPVKIISSPLRIYLDDILVIKNQVIKMILPSLGCALVAENRRSHTRLQQRNYYHIPKVNF